MTVSREKRTFAGAGLIRRAEAAGERGAAHAGGRAGPGGGAGAVSFRAPERAEGVAEHLQLRGSALRELRGQRMSVVFIGESFSGGVARVSELRRWYL